MAASSRAAWIDGGEIQTGERLWADAEDFLDVLGLAASADHDLVAAGQAGARRLERHIQMFLGLSWTQRTFTAGVLSACREKEMLGAFIQQMSMESRVLVAAQASAFMLTANAHTERWAPFMRWGSKLDENHSVITFNYDTAAEMAAGDKLSVVTDEASAKDRSKARLFKLHGSTSWLKVQNTTASLQIDKQNGHQWVCLLQAYADRICIGTPGPDKRRFSTYATVLWDGAIEAIKEAEVVIFAGYRFPPTDADARDKILDAIEGHPPGWLLLHTVLGPSTDDTNTKRLRGLLQSRIWRRNQLKHPSQASVTFDEGASRAGKVGVWGHLISHPLYSQDFVDAPGDLFHPHHRG